ncbi:ATP-binding protein [Thermococcus nautili]|uniref:Putative ATPase (AAA+ superfamily) n=1 Tax=Thermococcus nautili TaxID=195522 RepID=W8NT66_9EURY|nr:ATP-binding protein [Thermococcus nautili]AHL22443.1 putative ATPase (AAA+ superfamily) [Thermococcus nautili]
MIERETWAEVVLDYRSLPFEGIEREIEVKLPNTQMAVAIIGPRRVGKTYLMRQIMEGLKAEGVPEESIAYVNLEDPRLVGASLDDLMTLLEVLREMGGEKFYLFLDEVQAVEGWERFVRYLLDTGHRVFVSGSSSKLLSKEIATQLRGRSIGVRVFPFSFREFLRARGFQFKRYLSSAEKARLRALLGEYLEWGGYPEAVLNPHMRIEVLKGILDLAIYRDIVERWDVRNVSALRLLLKILARSSHLTLTKAYSTMKSLGISIGKGTVADYLEYLSDAFILHRLPPYVKSYKKAELLGFKPYLVDNGLLRIMGVKDRGRLLENLVMVELLRRGFEPEEDLFYVPGDGWEVDFLAGDELIQVSYELHPLNRERELGALAKAVKRTDAERLTVVTFADKGSVELNGKRIEVVPLHEWLLR